MSGPGSEAASVTSPERTDRGANCCCRTPQVRGVSSFATRSAVNGLLPFREPPIQGDHMLRVSTLPVPVKTRLEPGGNEPALGSGESRANTFVIILLGLQRLSYLAPPLVNQGAGYLVPTLNLALLAAVVGWNVLMFWQAKLRGWFSPWMAWTDVAIACALIVVVGNNVPADASADSLNWS